MPGTCDGGGGTETLNYLWRSDPFDAPKRKNRHPLRADIREAQRKAFGKHRALQRRADRLRRDGGDWLTAQEQADRAFAELQIIKGSYADRI